MLPVYCTFIKLAVDVATGAEAAGGKMHADCEEVLLDNGSKQEDIWGADWVPDKRMVEFESLINIRPRQGNRSAVVQSPILQVRSEEIVRKVFGS